MSRPSAGVIGAGIFGVAAALELAAAGADVTLYDKRCGILGGATAQNFFRVHRGYHYPRDEETARQARAGYAPFLGMFAEAMAPAVPSYYAIAAEGSLTTPAQFADHCARTGLEARPVTPPGLVPGSVQACFEADEFYYDPWLLRWHARERLARAGVHARLGWDRGAAAAAAAHDVAVVTAYAALNEVLAGLGCPAVELQYELCEVVIVRAPRLGACSLTVLDGPFCSIAPYGPLHLAYDVEHSVHARADGRANPRLERGPTRFGPIIASARRFTPAVEDARHAGSLFAERVVLPGADATDARPSTTWWAGPRVLAVLSGKVVTSVTTGRAVAAQVAAELALPEPEFA